MMIVMGACTEMLKLRSPEVWFSFGKKLSHVLRESTQVCQCIEIMTWLFFIENFMWSCDFQLAFVGFNSVQNLIVISTTISLYLFGFNCKGWAWEISEESSFKEESVQFVTSSWEAHEKVTRKRPYVKQMTRS